jgi:hypothetical protein
MPILEILSGNSILNIASNTVKRIPSALLDLNRKDNNAITSDFNTVL